VERPKATGKATDEATDEATGEATDGAPTGDFLPGLAAVPTDFDGTASVCFADHWVSNVVDREGFLATLEECLGFTPKVDFNAGVVAAGEAQIESTVTGNEGGLVTSDPSAALADAGQVFLPINNALSEVGHVHWYLEELGQGIQHVASRVQDLAAAVQRANDYRAVTGEGLAFLHIPRTYYGLVDATLIDECIAEAMAQELPSAWGGASAADEIGGIVLQALRAEGVVDESGAADLELVAALVSDEAPETEEERAVAAAKAQAAAQDGSDPVAAAGGPPKPLGARPLDAALSTMAAPGRSVPEPVKRGVSAALRFSAYRNLHGLLGDALDEKAYLSIVRNQILVDVQGGDVLMQIFTQCVLQREAGKEAPFLEFIQRLCGAAGGDGDRLGLIRPGCGGFGIRNFLTLFLSIEVSKALNDQANAAAAGDAAEEAFHAKRVELFTAQLVEANPILTEITEAMAQEGRGLTTGDEVLAAEGTARKASANEALQATSAKYSELMKAHRESVVFSFE